MRRPVLRAAGHEVVGLDTDLFAGCDFGDRPSRRFPRSAKIIRDLTKADLEGFDAVVHLAALSNDPLGNLNADLTYDINHRASVRLAELAKEAGVQPLRLLFVLQHVWCGRGWIHDETAPLNPVTAYAESKVLVERDLPGWQMNISAQLTCEMRPLTAHLRACGWTWFLNDLVASAYTTGRVISRATARPGVPSCTFATSLRRSGVLEAPQDAIHNETFNVGQTEENYRIRELADIVAETVPGCRSRVRSRRRPGQTLLPRQLRQDSARAAELPSAVDRPQGRAGTVRGLSRQLA